MKNKRIGKILEAEKRRQKSVINLIASENYVSADVLAALGSELTNKYAEGYSSARYYGGNELVDKLDDLCRADALKLFKLDPKEWAVNIQALSGSPANLAVYTALVPLGEKIMGMSLDHGGHLTHGHKASLTGKWWTQIPYGVSPRKVGRAEKSGANNSEVLDCTAIKKIAITEKPALIVAGYTAYSRIIDWKKFRQIADACGAHLHIDMSHVAGLVAGGVYPSPFPYADTVMTTVHKTLRGPRSALIFSRIGGKSGGKKGKNIADKKLAEKIDKAVFPGLQGGPHMNQIAAVAVALEEAMQPPFRKYAKQVVKNTKVLARELSKFGWRIVSGGTDSHLFLVDTWMDGKGISGKAAGDALEAAGIIVNKNTIPFDIRKPMDPSGIRIGTAAETTRGRKEKDMIRIAKKIDAVLRKEMKQGTNHREMKA